MSKSSPPVLDLKNVQGDILGGGLPKKAETYLFFGIEDGHADQFRTQLADLLPLITTGADVAGNRATLADHKKYDENHGKLLKLCGVNIAFSQQGLIKLGFKVDKEDKIGDEPFEQGMINDAALNDRPAQWFPEFRETIHGLIVVAAESQPTINEKLGKIQSILHGTIHVIKRTDGHVRPGKEEGHEHFGYLDGVSQPAVLGVDDTVTKGQELIRQGIILLGREGDSDGPGTQNVRPKWALDGSFLTFRHLSQLVPEFQGFVDEQNPVGAPKDLIGARLVGRWKSGAPIDVTPLKDDPKLAADPQRTNDFRFDPLSQDRCPFAAHVRKTNPRSDLTSTETHRILRRGITFGPEVTEEEKKKGTAHDRGLLFKAYQSSNANGFQFIQSSWANNTTFPFLLPIPNPKPGFTPAKGPGFDSIIGQAPNGGTRDIIFTNADDPAGSLNLPVEWVVTKGGEYFFSPSIPALKNRFSLAKPAKKTDL